MKKLMTLSAIALALSLAACGNGGGSGSLGGQPIADSNGNCTQKFLNDRQAAINEALAISGSSDSATRQVHLQNLATQCAQSEKIYTSKATCKMPSGDSITFDPAELKQGCDNFQMLQSSTNSSETPSRMATETSHQ